MVHNMFKYFSREQTETAPTTDKGLDAEGCTSRNHSLWIRVEYNRSLEYRLKWKSPMYSTCSSKLQKVSKKAQKSPSPNGDVIQRRRRSNRHTGLMEAQAADSVVLSDVGTDRDLMDLIDEKQDAEHMTYEDEGNPEEVGYESASESVDGDSGFSFCSMAYGPSVLQTDPLMKQSRPQTWCSACQKLHQKAKKMKSKLRDKLLDNDPTSLTCDQWVLMKKWRPRRQSNVKGRLWIHLRLIKQRLIEKQSEPCVGGREQSACSRPHTFLQRNLRRCVKVPVKSKGKKTRGKRKRTRDDAQEHRVTKQQRLHSNGLQQRTDSKSVDNSKVSLRPSDSNGSSPVSGGYSKQAGDDQADTLLIVELIPTTVRLETSRPAEASPQRKVRGFRNLLTQIRGNSSMIVRETR